MPKPNFIIVGAAKAGTTSLYRYLESHPQVFMPELKEPLFFIKESIKNHTVDPWVKEAIAKSSKGKTYIDKWEDYLKLFEGGKNAKAIGEASATYLYYYRESIPGIKKALGEAKIIIILRDPVKKAFSQYKYLKKRHAEPLSFKEGIMKENDRIEQDYSTLYHYTKQGFFAKQVEAFIRHFENVKVVLLNDLQKNPMTVLNEIADFLEIEPFEQNVSLVRHNATEHIPRSRFIGKIINHPLVRVIRKGVIQTIFPGYYKKIKNKLLDINSINPVLSDETAQLLEELFKNDVEKLEKVINRNLTCWKKHKH